MSKRDDDLPERLRLVGATHLEQRLIEAAGRERPSRELSERMARAIGVALPAGGTVGGEPAIREKAPETGAAAPQAATASSSFVPWIAAALVVAAMGGLVVLAKRRPVPTAPGAAVPAKVAEPAPLLPRGALAASPSPSSLPPIAAAKVERGAAPSGPASGSLQRGRVPTTESDLREQIALVDSARAALASGGADRALAAVRDYQTRYPSGAFRPEAAAVKVEALVKLGRAAEARTAAERFVSAYGPSPLAERVARLVGLSQP